MKSLISKYQATILLSLAILFLNGIPLSKDIRAGGKIEDPAKWKDILPGLWEFDYTEENDKIAYKGHGTIRFFDSDEYELAMDLNKYSVQLLAFGIRNRIIQPRLFKAFAKGKYLYDGQSVIKFVYDSLVVYWGSIKTPAFPCEGLYDLNLGNFNNNLQKKVGSFNKFKIKVTGRIINSQTDLVYLLERIN
jgi:hypothetical protein